MIHNNSHDPVLIKRIGLKIWSLRDEVEAVVRRRLQNNPEQTELTPEEIQQIKDEYQYRGPIDQRPNLQLLQGGGGATEAGSEEGGDGEDLEAAMAAAMGGDAPEEADASAEGEGGEDGEEDLEAAMAAAMDGAPEEATEGDQGAPAPGGPIKVIQRSSDNIPESKIHRGVTILSEVSMDSLYFFGSKKFLEGQSIVIEFQIPKRFVVNANIVYCRPFNIRSRIISEKKVSYRIVAQFSFLKDGERTLLRQFIRSIEPDVPEAPAPKAVKEDDGGDDDFDGLDGLDL